METISTPFQLANGLVTLPMVYQSYFLGMLYQIKIHIFIL